MQPANHSQIRSGALMALTFCFYAMLITFAYTENAAAMVPVLLDENFSRQEIGRNLEVLEDRNGKLTIKEVTDGKMSGRFAPSRSMYPNFGYSSSVYWIRFQVKNTSSHDMPWILEFAPPWIDKVDLYVPAASGYSVIKSGESLLFHKRPVEYKDYAFMLTEKPGISTYYMRLESGGSTLNIRLAGYAPRSFWKTVRTENSYLFIYYGLMIGMLLFNFFIAFSVKDKSYLYYVMFVASFILYIMCFEGTAYQLLWPSNVWWAKKSLVFFLLLTVALAIQFSRTFLNAAEYMPHADKILKMLLFMSGPGAFLTLVLNISWSDPVAVTIGSLTAMMLLAVGIRLILLGSRPAMFYIIAFSFILSGSIFNSLRVPGIINDNFFTIWGFETGSSMMVMLLSFALADSINDTRKKLSHAHLEMLNLNHILINERERLSVTLRSIGDGVITIDLTGNVVLINRVMELLTGWPQQESIGVHISRILTLADENSGQSGEFVLQELLNHDINSSRISALLLSRNNEKHIVSCGSAPIRDREGKTIGTVLVIRDITEQRRIDDDIIKASKIESLGLLAGGIAHDFNNILTVIMGSLAIAKINIGDPDKIYRHLVKAEDYSCQARSLTQQLLTFSKGGEPIKSPLDISRLLVDTSSFVMSGSNVKIEYSLLDESLIIEADETQISQVFNNLIINAIQAMPEGGRINVTGAAVFVPNDFPLPLCEGRYIKITIADQGNGIIPENLQKIFDPYFTTKECGTGLGLTSAYSIVKKHCGYIGVESTPGKGSTFFVYLPAVPESPPVIHAFENRILKGKGRILIMDDEDAICDVAVQLLAELGYESDSARDGEEAFEQYRLARESGKPYDAVLMDLTIPGGMGGKAAIQLFREYDIDVRAIVSSGYSNDPIMANFREYGFCAMVAKPYRIETLGEALQSVVSLRIDHSAY